METEWTHRFVSVKMYVFYIDILLLRQWVAVFSDETPSSPPDKPAELVEGWEEEVGDGEAVQSPDTADPYKAQSSQGCLCAARGKCNVGM